LVRELEAVAPARSRAFPVSLALASLSGVLWFLACTPYDLSALGWIAAVPMFVAIDRAPTLRQALFVGWWAGIVENAGGFHWVVQVLERFASLPLIAALAIFAMFCAYQGLVLLLFTLATRLIRARREVPFALLAPLLIAVCEWLLPELFPYGRFITQAWHPLVIQVAELTGPYGISALLMLVNGALYDLLRSGRAARVPAFGAVLVVLATLAFGAWRMRQMDLRIALSPTVTVGVVQPNVASPVRTRLTEQRALDQLTALQVQTHRLQQAGARLVVWSEGSYPFRIPRSFEDDDELAPPRQIRRDFNVPMVVGALTADSTHGEAYNSALLIDADGKTAGRYDKTRLVAFGEYIPNIGYFPWLRRQLPEGAGRFTAGTGPRLLIAQGLVSQSVRLAPLICYEDILPGYLRRTALLKPDLLVNLTSDSWFGAHAEPWQHLALSVFASVELRTSLVRAVNSGVSAYIDPNGRLIARTYAADPYLDPRPADGTLFTVALLSGGNTFYAAYGNVFVFSSLVLIVLIGACTRRVPL
jgi:apolipoprotein N-acyltransferase